MLLFCKKYKFKFKLLIFLFAICFQVIKCETYYNIPDPDCTGSFGLCTQRDKDILAYRAIKKLHEIIDDDHDGQVEITETKEFMKEELQYKHDFDRQNKLHGADTLITVDELWKSWKNSDVHNWTTDDVVFWLIDQVKLPQYVDNIKRNKIDGQFLPRFAVNENNYYATVLQIKDARHRNRMMLKATDLILFGQQARPNSLIKDVFMLTALTISLFGCIFAFSKHRQSQDQIKKMMKEFDQLGYDENMLLQFKNEKEGNSRRNVKDNADNAKLIDELKAAKDEAENLKKARESTISELQRLKLAEQELETVRMALQQTEKQLNLVKFQAPVQLVQLLTRTYESEKELLEFKFKLIDQEKESCLDALNKVSKRQSGILGALKIAHSSALEEINSKLELLKCQIQKCKIEKQEWTKRWTLIDEIISRSADAASNSNISDSSNSQDFPFISLENGLILPRRLWGCESSQSSLYNNNNNNNNNTNTAFTRFNQNNNKVLTHDLMETPPQQKSIYNLVSNSFNAFSMANSSLNHIQINNNNNINNSNNTSTNNSIYSNGIMNTSTTSNSISSINKIKQTTSTSIATTLTTPSPSQNQSSLSSSSSTSPSPKPPHSLQLSNTTPNEIKFSVSHENESLKRSNENIFYSFDNDQNLLTPTVKGAVFNLDNISNDKTPTNSIQNVSMNYNDQQQQKQQTTKDNSEQIIKVVTTASTLTSDNVHHLMQNDYKFEDEYYQHQTSISSKSNDIDDTYSVNNDDHNDQQYQQKNHYSNNDTKNKLLAVEMNRSTTPSSNTSKNSTSFGRSKTMINLNQLKKILPFVKTNKKVKTK